MMKCSFAQQNAGAVKFHACGLATGTLHAVEPFAHRRRRVLANSFVWRARRMRTE